MNHVTSRKNYTHSITISSVFGIICVVVSHFGTAVHCSGYEGAGRMEDTLPIRPSYTLIRREVTIYIHNTY